MKIKKKILSLVMVTSIIFSSFNMGNCFADGVAGGSKKVVTLGVNNTTKQKQTILDYFDVEENDPNIEIITVNNKEEREYLGKVATEEQLGTKTYSCAYVEVIEPGSGINVKTANITWVTSSMVASTLSTAGITGANCVIAAVFPVSGTGALTGVMKAFESATGESLDKEKKELASEELITTGDLGEEIGQDKAAGIVNDVKTEIIKNNTSDTIQIADTINNVTNNYNVTLSDEQVDKLVALMEKIAAQNYNYDEMKKTLNNVSDIVSENLKEAGENINNSGILDSIGSFFSGIGSWFGSLFSGDNSEDLGILGETKDSLLGSDTIINATNKAAEKLPTREEAEGFLAKIWNWITGLFSSDESNDDTSSENNDNKNSDTNDLSNEDKDVEQAPEQNIEQNTDDNTTEDSTTENAEDNTLENTTTEGTENTEENPSVDLNGDNYPDGELTEVE